MWAPPSSPLFPPPLSPFTPFGKRRYYVQKKMGKGKGRKNCPLQITLSSQKQKWEYIIFFYTLRCTAQSHTGSVEGPSSLLFPLLLQKAEEEKERRGDLEIRSLRNSREKPRAQRSGEGRGEKYAEFASQIYTYYRIPEITAPCSNGRTKTQFTAEEENEDTYFSFFALRPRLEGRGQ